MTNARPESSADGVKWKAGILVILFGVAFAIVGMRLFWVQVVEGARYRELARKQYESTVPLRAERGKIVDRNGREIATMMTTTSFAADPTLIQRVDELTALLEVVDGRPALWYRDRIRNEKSRFTWLARGINSVLYPDLDTLRDRGIIRVREPKRHFNYGPVAAQVIGTTDVDNNGLTGLELQYDGLLRGTPGFVVMQRDGRGRLRPSIDPERRAPADGAGLQLTLDIELQRVVEQELDRGVRETGSVGGTVIAMNPATGDVLAMASWPTFDPVRLDRTSSDAIRIKGITDVYEPGSTMKAIAAAALLEERKLASTDIVDGMGGSWVIYGQTIRDDHPVGKVSFAEALEQSSNVAIASAVRQLDPRVYYKYVRDFGFGLPTGIDLPGEVRGRLQRPNQFEAATPLFMSFGYGLSATAMQLVSAYACIANGGVLMQPRIIASTRTASGEVDTEVPTQRIRRVVSEATSKTLTDMLVGVVERGTGQQAKIQGLRIAGKTGTAQQLDQGTYSRTNYTASFVGYYPADNPHVAMIVMLDRPTSTIYGGATAAPIFRRIVQKTITMLNVDESVRHAVVATVSADTIVVPDIRGVSNNVAEATLRKLGLRSRTSGIGVVALQMPVPGSKVERGTTIKLAVHHSDKGGTAERPSVTGFTLRRAIAVLQASGYRVRVRGIGKVVSQSWNADTCTIVAQ